MGSRPDSPVIDELAHQLESRTISNCSVL